MATSNARRYLYLETVLNGKPGSQVSAKISKHVKIFLDNDFAIQCYQSPTAHLRTIAHMLPTCIDDPVIRGFHFRRFPSRFEIKVVLNKTIQTSKAFAALRGSTDVVSVLALLSKVFQVFQPVASVHRPLLNNHCRATTFYDVPRLIAASRELGEALGFDPSALIIAYERRRDSQTPVVFSKKDSAYSITTTNGRFRIVMRTSAV